MGYSGIDVSFSSPVSGCSSCVKTNPQDLVPSLLIALRVFVRVAFFFLNSVARRKSVFEVRDIRRKVSEYFFFTLFPPSTILVGLHELTSDFAFLRVLHAKVDKW